MLKSVLAAGAALSLTLAVAPAAFAQDAMTHDPAQVHAGAYTLDTGHGKITWAVTHLGFSTYRGQFTGVEATLNIDPKHPAGASLQATIDTRSLGSLNPKLDEHLSGPDFFDTAKFPTATFQSTRVALTSPRTARIDGQLTLHGVTHPVTLQATFNQAGYVPMMKAYRIGFDGHAVIKRSDFGINAYVPAVSDEVTLDFEAEFQPQK